MNYDYAQNAASDSLLNRRVAEAAAAQQMQAVITAPISERIAISIKQANEAADRLSNMVDLVCGPSPVLASAGQSDPAAMSPTPLARQMDHLGNALDRIQRHVDRLNGAL